MAYSKLHSSIVNSSLWCEPDHIRILFITMLALCDREGYVYGSKMGIERTAMIDWTPGEDRDPWVALMAPDTDSSDKLRAPENEGRRIEEVPGGFRLLNFAYYRGLRNDDDRRDQNRRAQEKYRSKPESAKVSQGQPRSATVIPVKPQSAASKPISDADADPLCTLSGSYHGDSRTVLHLLNEASGLRYREVDSNLSLISQRLSEPEVTLEGVKLMIQRQVKLWKGTEMEQYLRPGTLFNKTKFDSYYTMRAEPTVPTRSSNQKYDPSIQTVDHGLNALERL